MSRQSDKDLATLYLYYYVNLYPQDGDAIIKAVKIIEIVGAAHREKPYKDYQGEFLDVPCTTMEIYASDASIYDPEHIYQVYWRGIGASPIRWKNGYMYNREQIEQEVANLQEELANKSSVNSSRERNISSKRNTKFNSSADVDRYLNITSMDSDNTKYAYSLEITSENSRSIYAESDVYGWTYRVDKNTTAVWLDGKKIANSCTYSIDEYFDVERPVNSSKRSKKLNSSLDPMDAIDALREYKETIEDTIPGLKEELDWLSIEIQDYVDGELDDSYAEHVKACIDELQEIMDELHKLHTGVHVFINELD